MEPFEHFAVPATWGSGYAKLAGPVPHCANYQTVQLAANLVTHLINPALTGQADRKTWRHDTLSWS
jgi:hypothetical protein